MRVAFPLVFLSTLVLSVAACSGGGDDDDDDDDGGGTPLTGDVSGAVGLALLKPADEPASGASFGEVAPVDTNGEPFFTLVKIDGDGNVDPVFNQLRPIHWVEVNDTHVAVSGRFDDVTVLQAGSGGEASIDCKLVVFPRTATGETVTCLTAASPGFPGNDPLLTEGVPIDYPGFTARGTDVFFTDLIQPSPTEGVTKLWRWQGGSDVIDLMLQLEDPLALAQPFAADGGSHVCAVSHAGGHPNGEETLYCSPLAAANWQVAPEDAGGFADRRALVLGATLVTGWSRVNLMTGEVVETGSQALPSGRRHTIHRGTEAFGIRKDIAATGGDLVFVNSAGGVVLDASVDWELIAGQGNGAFVYGTSQLRRLDFGTRTLEAENLLGSTTLLQVTDMSITTDDRIRLDGTTSAGFPAIVLVNTSSGEVTVTEEDVPRFQSVVPLQ